MRLFQVLLSIVPIVVTPTPLTDNTFYPALIKYFDTSTKQDAIAEYGEISEWDTSKVTGMSHMFRNSDFNGDISKWNTGAVTDMNNMFENSAFNGDISEWNTGAVSEMTYMFSGSQFNGDISEWNTGAVISMWRMFANSDFNGDISKWNTGAVFGMYDMFSGSQFNGDISKWDTGKVTGMGGMFYNSAFERTLCGGKWFSLQNSASAFTNTGSSNVKYECTPLTDLNVISAVGRFLDPATKQVTIAKYGDIAEWNTGAVTDMNNMFENSDFNGDISEWNTGGVLNMNFMFSGSPFNGDISKWNTGAVLLTLLNSSHAGNNGCEELSRVELKKLYSSTAC